MTDRRTARGISPLAVLALSAALAGLAVVAAPQPASAATFTVNRIGDAADLNLSNAVCDVSANSGNQCTLRAAIQEANDTPGADTINFNITSSSKTITPATPLPPITGRVTINGYSQPNTSVNTLATGNNAVLRIILDGVNLANYQVGLELDANDSVIRGLVLQRFSGVALKVDGSGNSIRGNFIGTTAAGTGARGNGQGIYVAGSRNTIGGTARGMRNLISGNNVGVWLSGLSPVNNVIANNYIGTTKNGMAALGNTTNGVYVDHNVDCIIGTGTAGGANVISANGGDGIRIYYADGCSIRGNRIGTRADGTGDLGNGFGGVLVLFTPSVVVGGPTAAERNTIANNVSGIGASDSQVDAIGNTIVGHTNSGLSFSGSTGMVQGNAIIANATTAGHAVNVQSGSVVRITANQMLANGGLGINLNGGTEDGAGVTANDAGDADTGPNGLQNYPVITSAQRLSNGVTVISGQLNSLANTQFRIELFLVTGAADPSGNGEAQAFIATQNITTNGSGNRSFTFQLGGLVAGHKLTMSAIRSSNGHTSEFAENISVVPAP